MLFLLEKHNLKELAIKFIVMPTNPIQFHEYRRDNTKTNRIILNGFSDHIFPHIIEKGNNEGDVGYHRQAIVRSIIE